MIELDINNQVSPQRSVVVQDPSVVANRLAAEKFMPTQYHAEFVDSPRRQQHRGAALPVRTTVTGLFTFAAFVVAACCSPILTVHGHAAASRKSQSIIGEAVERGLRAALGNSNSLLFKKSSNSSRQIAVGQLEFRAVAGTRSQKSLGFEAAAVASSSSSSSFMDDDEEDEFADYYYSPFEVRPRRGGEQETRLVNDLERVGQYSQQQQQQQKNRYSYYSPHTGKEREFYLQQQQQQQWEGQENTAPNEWNELDNVQERTIPCGAATTTTSTATATAASATVALAPAFTASSSGTSASGSTHHTSTSSSSTSTNSRQHARSVSSVQTVRPLAFWENMICGAISRSVAQTIMHPANTMKTILQNSRANSGPTIVELLQPQYFRRLTIGAGANFILSVPHGAVNFAVLEFVRKRLADVVLSNAFLNENAGRLGPGLDFLSSAISTITCSIVSTPQMMITDNIMAGNFPNLPAAIKGLYQERGVMGFYSGWWPGLVGKIPSYALTWTIFQQLKETRNRLVPERAATDLENSIMGCIASATTVCIMIPMDTIKTRLVTQGSRKAATAAVAAAAAGGVEYVAYKGIIDCAIRVIREEGIGTFYRGLPPRLVSVVPMIGIQFGVYEAMKKAMLKRKVQLAIAAAANAEAAAAAAAASRRKSLTLVESQQQHQELVDGDVQVTEEYDREGIMEEAMMEVAASPEHPYPAPQFLHRQVVTKAASATTATKEERSKRAKKDRRNQKNKAMTEHE